MDGPVGGSITGTELHFKSATRKVVVVLWAGIIKYELIGPFQVEDRLKITPKPTASFSEDYFFTQWSRRKYASFKKTIFMLHHMHLNAPLHG